MAPGDIDTNPKQGMVIMMNRKAIAKGMSILLMASMLVASLPAPLMAQEVASAAPQEASNTAPVDGAWSGSALEAEEQHDPAAEPYVIGEDVSLKMCIRDRGIILKKTKMFAGQPAPFVMELPAYHLPTLGNVLRSMWERGWSFIKKAGTIILLSTIVIWFTTYFGFTDEGFRMLTEDELDRSILAAVGGAIAWIFTPLGFGSWEAAVASITGLVAKENICLLYTSP